MFVNSKGEKLEINMKKLLDTILNDHPNIKNPTAKILT